MSSTVHLEVVESVILNLANYIVIICICCADINSDREYQYFIEIKIKDKMYTVIITETSKISKNFSQKFQKFRSECGNIYDFCGFDGSQLCLWHEPFTT